MVEVLVEAVVDIVVVAAAAAAAADIGCGDYICLDRKSSVAEAGIARIVGIADVEVVAGIGVAAAVVEVVEKRMGGARLTLRPLRD